MRPYLVDLGTHPDSVYIESVKANNGQNFELDADNLSFTVQALLDMESVTAYKDNDQTKNFVPFKPLHNGVQIPKIGVNLYIPKSNPLMLNTLYMFVKTKGLKRLYCDLAQIMFDTIQQEPYFEGYVTNLRVTENRNQGEDYFFVSFDFVVVE